PSPSLRLLTGTGTASCCGPFVRRGLPGDHEVKDGSAGTLAVDPDPTTVRLDGELAERQAQAGRRAGSGTLKAAKLSEYNVVIRRWNPDTIVLHREANPLVVSFGFRGELDQ